MCAKRTKTPEELRQICFDVHEGKYSYERSDFTTYKSYIDIHCPKHGMFKKMTSAHMRGEGCKACLFNRYDMTGKVFDIGGGIKVTIVDYESYDKVTVEDTEGLFRIVSMDSLKTGKVAWKGKKLPRRLYYTEGQEIALDCGVTVTVGERLDDPAGYMLHDKFGNSKFVKIVKMCRRSIKWPFRVPGNKAWLFEIGHKFKSQNNKDLEIVGYGSTVSKYTVKDLDGRLRHEQMQSRIKAQNLPWFRDKVVSKKVYPMGYYVYICRHKGSIVYIGSGTKGRLEHINSGKSHSIELNRHFFLEDDKLSVEVCKEGLSQEESLLLETSMIRQFIPLYNKQNLGLPSKRDLELLKPGRRKRRTKLQIEQDKLKDCIPL